MSDIAALTGDWNLVAWAFVWALELPQTDNANMDAARFLYDTTPCAVSEFEPANGSHLSIFEDKSFTQTGTGNANILSYDAEGIQINGLSEFSGNLSVIDGTTNLIAADISDYDTPKGQFNLGRLRLDNGSMKIRDSIEVRGETLDRVIRVVTDYSYGDCVVLRYKKS